MAKSTTATTIDKPKRTRMSKPRYYIADIAGRNSPTLILAKSQKEALDRVLTLRLAEPRDILTAGREKFEIIDATIPADPLMSAA